MNTRSGLLAIIRKEFKRFFSDYRIVATTIFIPGLMIYTMYSFIGGAVENLVNVDATYEPQVFALNLPDSLKEATSMLGLDFVPVKASELDQIKEGISNKELDLLVVFPADFDSRLGRQLSGEQGVDLPRIEIFYNSTRTESSYQYQLMMALLDQYKTALAPLFTVNSGADASLSQAAEVPNYDLATDADVAGFMFASLLPLFILIFLISGCMSIAPESIAGEKERGTIATMLVTPLSRFQLALGKIISLSCIALLSGLSSFMGVMLSLPKLIGALPEEATAQLYGLTDYLMLLVVILSTVLVFVGVVSILSAIARTVKEATTYITPMMIIVTVIGITGLFAQGADSNLVMYLIPIYNTVQSLAGIFSLTANPLYIAITVASNIFVASVCVYILTWMFGSERVLFSR